MKRRTAIWMSLMMLVMPLFGCSQINGGGTSPTIDQVAVQVERFTELAAVVAFSRADVQPYKDTICKAASSVSAALEKYQDPTATLSALKTVVHNAINSTNLTETQKRLAVLVLDQVMDTTLVYVESNYKDLISKDPVKNTLTIAKAIANGLTKACNPVATASSVGTMRGSVPSGRLQ